MPKFRVRVVEAVLIVSDASLIDTIQINYAAKAFEKRSQAEGVKWCSRSIDETRYTILSRFHHPIFTEATQPSCVVRYLLHVKPVYIQDEVERYIRKLCAQNLSSWIKRSNSRFYGVSFVAFYLVTLVQNNQIRKLYLFREKCRNTSFAILFTHVKP